MGPTLLSNRSANRGWAYVLDVADALHSPMPFTAAGWHRSRRKLRRRRRVAANAAAHVLALAGEAPGVRGRWRWRFLASRPETERPAQGSLRKKCVSIKRIVESKIYLQAVDFNFPERSKLKNTSKRATGRCPDINRINLDNTKEF